MRQVTFGKALRGTAALILGRHYVESDPANAFDYPMHFTEADEIAWEPEKALAVSGLTYTIFGEDD